MYKLVKSPFIGLVNVVNKQVGDVLYSIPFDPANTDYANFKEQILANEAELQDADGNVLIPSMAKDFVNTLP
jgi:hypothetical protein